MASLDTLPGDQRAVLELVMRQGRGYDEIERLLSIDRTAVRARALAALDAIGPPTTVPATRRALLADYLLGQLPPRVSDEVRARLADAPDERAWVQAIASELAPIASKPLPEIPAGPVTPVGSEVPSEVSSGAFADEERSAGAPPAGPTSSEPPGRPASRLGGAILLGIGVLVAVAVAVYLITKGGARRPPSTSAQVRTTSTGASAVSTAGASGVTATTTTTAGKIIDQVLLLPPGHKGKAKGAAAVVVQGTSTVLDLAASGLAPNKHNAYAVWLFNSPTDEYRVGYYTPGVGRDGRLLTQGLLPTNAARYKQLLLALEPVPAPNRPTKIVLRGALHIR